MTKQEIIDALCQCAESTSDCKSCPYNIHSHCSSALMRDAAQALRLTLCDKTQVSADSAGEQE